MSKKVELGLVVETEGVPPVRAVATIPPAWMTKGFLAARDRVDKQAAASTTMSQGLTIALFEASNWLDSLKDKVQRLERDGHVKALNFARKSIKPTVRPDGRPVLWDFRSV
jgi:hypothetical protein